MCAHHTVGSDASAQANEHFTFSPSSTSNGSFELRSELCSPVDTPVGRLSPAASVGGLDTPPASVPVSPSPVGFAWGKGAYIYGRHCEARVALVAVKLALWLDRAAHISHVGVVARLRSLARHTNNANARCCFCSLSHNNTAARSLLLISPDCADVVISIAATTTRTQNLRGTSGGD